MSHKPPALHTSSATPNAQATEKEEEAQTKNRVNNAGAPQTLLTRQIQQMQQLLKNSKV
ncbi:protein of unknown function [Alcaligenes faecalis subsp. faecalis]|nr:protein of unknown function [Alcaligenes faecalis subsp. faecalis]